MLVRALLKDASGKELQLDFCHLKTKSLIKYFTWDCLDSIKDGSNFEEAIDRRLGLVGLIKRKGKEYSVVIANAELPKISGKNLDYFTKGYKEKRRKGKSWFGSEYEEGTSQSLQGSSLALIKSFEDGPRELLLLEKQLNNFSSIQAIIYRNKKSKVWSIVHVTKTIPHDMQWHECFTKSHLLLFPNKWRDIHPVIIELNDKGAFCHHETAKEMGSIVSRLWQQTKGPHRYIRVTDFLRYKEPEIFNALPVDICGGGSHYLRTTFCLSRALKRPFKLRHKTEKLPLNGLCAEMTVPEDGYWHKESVKDRTVKSIRAKNANTKDRSIYVELRGKNGGLFTITDCYGRVQKSKLTFDTLKAKDRRVFYLPGRQMYVLYYSKADDGKTKLTLKKANVDIESSVRIPKGRSLFGYHYVPGVAKNWTHTSPFENRALSKQKGQVPFWGQMLSCEFIERERPAEGLSVQDGYLKYNNGRFEICGWYKCNPGSSPSIDLICIDHKTKTFSFLGVSAAWSLPAIILCGNYLIEGGESTDLTRAMPTIVKLTKEGPKVVKPSRESAEKIIDKMKSGYEERERKYNKAYRAGTLHSFKQSTYVTKRLAFEGHSTDKYLLHFVRPKVASVKKLTTNSIELTCRYSTTAGDLVNKSHELQLLPVK